MAKLKPTRTGPSLGQEVIALAILGTGILLLLALFSFFSSFFFSFSFFFSSSSFFFSFFFSYFWLGCSSLFFSLLS